MQTFTIGKVARLAGVGLETVRFYEQEGLIAEPPRGVLDVVLTRQHSERLD